MQNKKKPFEILSRNHAVYLNKYLTIVEVDSLQTQKDVAERFHVVFIEKVVSCVKIDDADNLWSIVSTR